MNTLLQGDNGTMVEYLQLALFRSGYAIRIDGIFGNETKSGVITFQRNNSLSQDGIAGPKTWEKLLPYLRGFTYYTIRNGDSFYSIAQKFSTTPPSIQSANPSLRPENLPVGQTIIVPFGFPLIPSNVSYSYPLMKLLMEGLIARYPFIRLNSIGQSVMGKNLYVLSVGTGEIELFYNASHHANEWITTPVLLTFLEEYAQSYLTDGEIFGYKAKMLYSSTTLYLVPLVNPDGVDLVNGVLEQDSTFYISASDYAKNYPQIQFPDGWKANIAGIDTNLSYPALWETAKEIKTAQGFVSPAPRDYVGTAPLEAVESAAVYRFTLEHDFALTLSYHTQGEVIYWQFQDYLPENSREIGEMFANVSRYALEETPYQSSFAGYKDWFIQNYNRPGYTIEAGSGQNPLPISQFSKIYKDNIGILSIGLGLFTDTPLPKSD